MDTEAGGITAARYFDGRSSRPRLVELAVVGPSLSVVGDGVAREVGVAQLSLAPPTDRGPARIAIADGTLCEIDDRDAAATLFHALGHRPAATDRLVSSTGRVLLVVAAFVLLMASAYRWGIPWAADRAVDAAPLDWDRALGDAVLQTLDTRESFEPTRLDEAVQQRVVRRFRALKPLPDAPEMRIVFRQFAAPNALALPGGVIVVTDAMVDVAAGDDDALATVLAHELGHVAHRDGMRQLARSTIASALASWYLGDISSTAGVIAGSIGTLRYSREAEHEADLYALSTMRANGISTKGAATLFRRLEAWQPPGARTKRSSMAVPEYLSTHPDTDDRIRLFDEGAR